LVSMFVRLDIQSTKISSIGVDMRQALLICPLMNQPLKMLMILQIKDTFPFSRTREAVPFRSYIVEVPVPASRSIDQLQSSWPMKLQRACSTCHNRVQSVEDPRTAWVKESERERDAGVMLPTGSAKPAGSGTGIPDRFGRKPVQTSRSQI